jgi:predicted RNA binding protein YcfA (HicA-like mRNA interferase family)
MAQPGHLTTIPDWGPQDLKPGTLRAIIAQLGLDWETFRAA